MYYLQEAIEKYNEVLQTLEFSRDLQKQFQSIGADVSNFMKQFACVSMYFHFHHLFV
jgi:hypothetical protein